MNKDTLGITSLLDKIHNTPIAEINLNLATSLLDQVFPTTEDETLDVPVARFGSAI